jgi:hypothetical protein
LEDSFVIESGVKVNVFIKIEDFTKVEVLYLADKFDDYYSNYPELFRDRFSDYINSMED